MSKKPLSQPHRRRLPWVVGALLAAWLPTGAVLRTSAQEGERSPSRSIASSTELRVPHAAQEKAFEKIQKIEELRFIRETAESLGLRVCLFSSTATDFIRSLSREDTPSLASTFRTNSFLDLAIDGPEDKAKILIQKVQEKYPYDGEGESRWDFRLFETTESKEGLRSARFLNQAHDSTSFALVQLTGPKETARISDLKHLDTGLSPLWHDLQEGKLRYFPAQLDPHLKPRPHEKPIFSAIRYLTHAFEAGLEPTPESEQAIRKIFQGFEVDADPYSYTSTWIAKNLPSLFTRAQDPARASVVIHELGLARKLIETYAKHQQPWSSNTIAVKDLFLKWPKEGVPPRSQTMPPPDTSWLAKVKPDPELLPNVSQAFIAPNEPMHTAFAQPLAGKKGVLVSVGTFRTLHDSVMGDFSHAVLMDFHPGVNAFNRVNLELIKKAGNRHEYLSLLLTGSIQTARDLAHTRIGEMAYIEALLDRTPPDWVERWRDLAQLSEAEYHDLKKLNLADLRNKLRNSFRDYAHHKTLNHTIFGSDAWFQRIQKNAKEGRYLILGGSLSGEQAMFSLGQALRSADLEVSVVDVSNAPLYIDKMNQGPQRFLRNLNLLPWSKDGTILLTADHHPMLKHRTSGFDHRWDYLAIHHDWYRESLRRAGLSNSEEFYSILARHFPAPTPRGINHVEPVRRIQAVTIDKHGTRLDEPCSLLRILRDL